MKLCQLKLTIGSNIYDLNIFLLALQNKLSRAGCTAWWFVSREAPTNSRTMHAALHLLWALSSDNFFIKCLTIEKMSVLFFLLSILKIPINCLFFFLINTDTQCSYSHYVATSARNDGEEEWIMFANYIFSYLLDGRKCLCLFTVVSCNTCNFTAFSHEKCQKKMKNEKTVSNKNEGKKASKWERVTPGWTDIQSCQFLV